MDSTNLDDGTAVDTRNPSYGPQNINKRLSRAYRRSPASYGPVRPPVYPIMSRFQDPHIRPEALRVHPKGFKVLSKRSPLDRNISTYFRLPPRPSKRVEAQRRELFETATRIMEAETSVRGVVLDGFMLLTATGVKDPADAEECIINDSHVVDIVAEDLAYFTGLKFLDLGENQVPLGKLAALSALEELHLHCNMIKTISDLELVNWDRHGTAPPPPPTRTSDNVNAPAAQKEQKEKPGDGSTINNDGTAAGAGLPSSSSQQPPPLGDEQPLTTATTANDTATEDATAADARLKQQVEAASRQGSFPKLHTLNLSFNQIPPDNVTLLALIPQLARLDLSCNNLQVLPESLATLVSLRQLALENNKFDSDDVIRSLSTLPSLEELNLNYNALQRWPGDVPQHGFPSLTVLGLAANQFTYFEDLFPLKLMAATPRIRLAMSAVALHPLATTASSRDDPNAAHQHAPSRDGATPGLHPLSRVVLWGNPIEQRPKDRDIVLYEFRAVDVQIVLQTPLPPKKKGGEFCRFGGQAASPATPRIQLVTVPRVTSKGLDVGSTRDRRMPQSKGPAGADASSSAAAGGAPGDKNSFFVTAVDPSSAAAHDSGTSGAAAAGGVGADSTSGQSPAQSGAADSPGSAPNGGASKQQAGSWFHSRFQGGDGGAGPSVANRAAMSSADAQQRATAALPPIANGRPRTMTGLLDDPTALAAADEAEELSALDICRPNATMRTVLNDLKRALRQPLPPLPSKATNLNR